MMGTSLVVQWLKICLPMRGMKVQSLVRELRSHMPQGNKALEPQTTEPTHFGGRVPQWRIPDAATKTRHSQK